MPRFLPLLPALIGMGVALVPFRSSPVVCGWMGMLIPSVKGIEAGRVIPLDWDPGSPVAPFKLLEAAVKDAETCETGPSGGDDDRDNDARDRAAAVV